MVKVKMIMNVMAIMIIFGSMQIKAKMDESEVIHVGGKVMCQDCTQSWNDWVKGANPIKGARVSVTCLDDRKRVAFYKSDTTDDDGVFNMIVEKIVFGKKLNPRNCLVRLVSSPDSCNIATNFAGGKTGVKLTQPSVVYRDITKYVLGPFYYTTPTCADSDDDATQ